MRSRWLSGSAMALHLVVVVLVCAFSALAWWQVSRAISGNTLSWVYAFEWPFFAGYAIYMWWRLLHEGAEGIPRRRPSARQTSAEQTAEEEERLAAYNRYLADLKAGAGRRTWRDP